jgi:hypothetical protein
MSLSDTFSKIVRDTYAWRMTPEMTEDARQSLMARLDEFGAQVPTVEIAYALGAYKGAVAAWPSQPRSGSFIGAEMAADRAIYSFELRQQVSSQAGI